VKESLKLVIRRNIFEKEEDDKLRVDPKHLVHYMLSWITCVDNYCDIYKILKTRNYKYLVRIYWMLSKAKYKNADYMYR